MLPNQPSPIEDAAYRMARATKRHMQERQLNPFTYSPRKAWLYFVKMQIDDAIERGLPKPTTDQMKELENDIVVQDTFQRQWDLMLRLISVSN